MAIPDYKNPIDIGNNPSVVPTAQQVAAVKQALAANTPKPPANYPNLVGSLLDASSWSSHRLEFTNAQIGVPTVYWAWPFKTDKLVDPLDAWHLYFSTDHDAGAGGIYLMSGPTRYGPWTLYGQCYVDLSTPSTGQTETPSVVWDPFNNCARLFYQQTSAKYGAGDSIQAIGDQSTLACTSTDGIHWTKDPNFVIQKPGNALIYGDGHMGYFLPFMTPRGQFAYSLAGGGAGPAFVLHQSYGPADQWKTDWRPLPFCLDLTQGAPLNGRRVEWNSSFIVSSGGVEYWVGRLSDGAYSTFTADCRIGIAPVSPDYRRLLSRPTVIWQPTEPWETADMRSLTYCMDEGVLDLRFTIGKTHVGVISHVL